MLAAGLSVAVGSPCRAAAGADADVPAQIEVVPRDGPLRPGVASVIHVAFTGEADPEVAPRVTVSAGRLRPRDHPGPSVWTYVLEPPLAVDAVDVQVDGGSVRRVVRLQVVLPPTSHLGAPERIDGIAGSDTLTFRVTGEDLPPADALQVVVGEGRLLGVEVVEDALEVHIDPEDLPFPRTFPIAIRDRRRDEQPRWVTARLRARPALPLRTDPGSQVTVTVGGRDYGPFRADAAGGVVARVDQYPGEVLASAVFTDELGNRKRTDLPLAVHTQVHLVPVVLGQLAPGRRSPLVYLRAAPADGGRWTGAAPTCRTPAVDLAVRALDQETWMVPLPALDPDQPEDVRVACALAEGISQSFRVPVAPGIPARLRLRVWPDELRTDFPSAEVRVVLEDIQGERLPVSGVSLRARYGTVVLDDGGDRVLLGEYVGSAAAERGGDTVVASWTATGEGTWIEHLDLAWGAVPLEGSLRVHARATDPFGLPVAGVPVSLSAGEPTVDTLTDPAGWASAELPIGPGRGPVVLRASTAGHQVAQPLVRGQPGSAGPDAPDLVDRRLITISPGRVVGISVEVDPPLLRAKPGSVAQIRVQLQDRTGNPITDEQPQIEVSDGEVGAAGLQAREGHWVFAYTPSAIETARDVTITARTDTLRSSTTLRLEPKPVRFAIGPWAGVQSNFGGITAPIFGLDLDMRLSEDFIGGTSLLRISGWTYAFNTETATGLGADARIQSQVYPLAVLWLLREDTRAFSLFGGAGTVLALHRMNVRFGDDLVSRATLFRGGATVLGGVSRRALGGELALTTRFSWLTSSTGGEVGFVGNIGGVAITGGYRLVF